MIWLLLSWLLLSLNAYASQDLPFVPGEYCTGLISPDFIQTSIPGEYRTLKAELSCLVNGLKPIAWAQDYGYQEEIEEIAQKHGILWYTIPIKDKKDTIKHVIFFLPDHKKDALLFARYLIERKTGAVTFNDYLIGTLLGYRLENIIYFYQRYSFMHETGKLQGNRTIVPGKTLTDNEVAAFNLFIKENCSWEASYNKDKVEADEWLKKQRARSIRDHEDFIAEYLKTFANQETGVEPAAPPAQPVQPAPPASFWSRISGKVSSGWQSVKTRVSRWWRK